MTDNPYSPPVEEALPAALGVAAPPLVHWFSPAQVGICTFFGGPLAGTVLLWLNARAARWEHQTEVFLGVFAVLAILVIAFALPSNASIGLGFAGAFSLHSLAKLQLASYLRERPRPLPRRGWVQLGVVLAGIAGTALLAVLAAALVAVLAPGLIHD